MERIKVSLPVHFYFSTIVKVRITDLNYGNHVGNDVFLSLAHEARQQFLQQLGYTELNIEGAGLIMANSAIEYKKELKYGDEVKISVAIAGIDKLGFDLFYLFEVRSVADWSVAAKIKTGMLCFDYTANKRVQISDKAVAKINAFQLSGDKGEQPGS